MSTHEANGTDDRQLPAIGWRSGALLDHHRAELHKSGLTDETIKAAGIYSETRPDALGTILALGASAEEARSGDRIPVHRRQWSQRQLPREARPAAEIEKRWEAGQV
jgi:hypothetical protein